MKILLLLKDVWTVIKPNLDSSSILANFLGGLGVVAFLFLWNELFRPKKNLTGQWEVKNTILNTEYIPFRELKVVWKMHLLQNGNLISGSGEKIKDIKKDGNLEEEYLYEPVQRDNVEIQGYIEKNYLRKSRIFINVIQVGRLRRTRATYVLKLTNSSTLTGVFVTTAGNSKGNSIFIKNA